MYFLNLLVKLHSYTDCCWSGHTGSENGAGNFSLSATMNLTARSDTGTINSSPVSGSIPIIRQPSNCPRVITFPREDPDGDTVRCQQVKMVETPGGGNPASSMSLIRYVNAPYSMALRVIWVRILRVVG